MAVDDAVRREIPGIVRARNQAREEDRAATPEAMRAAIAAHLSQAYRAVVELEDQAAQSGPLDPEVRTIFDEVYAHLADARNGVEPPGWLRTARP